VKQAVRATDEAFRYGGTSWRCCCGVPPCGGRGGGGEDPLRHQHGRRPPRRARGSRPRSVSPPPSTASALRASWSTPPTALSMRRRPAAATGWHRRAARDEAGPARARLAVSCALSAKDAGSSVVARGEQLVRLGEGVAAQRGRGAAGVEPAREDASLGDGGGGLGLGLHAPEAGLAADQIGLGLLQRVLQEARSLLEPPVLLADLPELRLRPLQDGSVVVGRRGGRRHAARLGDRQASESLRPDRRFPGNGAGGCLGLTKGLERPAVGLRRLLLGVGGLGISDRGACRLEGARGRLWSRGRGLLRGTTRDEKSGEEGEDEAVKEHEARRYPTAANSTTGRSTLTAVAPHPMRNQGVARAPRPA